VFREGFPIFRTYLGQTFRAHASAGAWVLEPDGQRFSSLNELSKAIGAKTENAWVNWFFVDDAGTRRPVGDLRDPSTVASRSKGNLSFDNLHVGTFIPESREDATWRDDVRDALTSLGGRASLQSIYRAVRDIRRSAGRSLPQSLEATVRRTLEDHSSDSANFRGADLFHMPEGKGAGVWSLR
jgi:hypothetical protein